uniref:Uncharacterized protein n=1 Tax=Anopheles atroparvus TaxID=41427 RepID=A0A182J2P9_ANOAO
MHVIVLKYVQVLCITIFFSNNINCDKLLLHNEQEDQELYRIGACTALCLADTEDPTGPTERSGSNGTAAEPKSIERCYTRCSEDRRPLSAWRPLVQRQAPPLRINLICRDSTNLIIEVQSTNGASGREETINEERNSDGVDDELAARLDAPVPQGKHNQSEPLDGNREQATNVTAELSKVTATARSKRAIGAGGSPPTADQKPDSSAGNRANLLPYASVKRGPGLAEDGRRSASSGPGRMQHHNPPRPTGQPIYLVKVQESEKELGDRIVYMSGALEEAATDKLRRIIRQRDHVLAKVVRMQRQVAEMQSIGRAKCSVLARMSSKHYDEFAKFHSTAVGLIDSKNELEEQEEIYKGFENIYVDLNVTLEELTLAVSKEQKEYQKEEELKKEEHEGLEKHEQDQGGQDQKQLPDPDKETTTGDVVVLIKHSSVGANDQDGQDQKLLQEEQHKETSTGDIGLMKHSSVSAEDLDGQDQKQLQEQDEETTTEDEETTTEDAALIKRKAIMVIRYLMLMWGDPTVEDLLRSNRKNLYNHQEYEQQFYDIR